MSPTERREQLLEWMKGQVFTDIELIVTWSLLYAKSHVTDNPEARCRRDLNALEQEGKVRRLPGRPARWEVVR